MKNYNKDIMDWRQFPEYDIIWCDPPWGAGLVKMFHTYMRKAVGHAPNNTLEDILEKLAELADPSKPAIVEYSVKGTEVVKRIMTNAGHKLHNEFEGIYWEGRPFKILVFNSDLQVITRRTDQNIVTDTLSGLDRMRVFDPFAGIGATAKAVRAAGHEYIGSELNPARFEKLQKVNT